MQKLMRLILGDRRRDSARAPSRRNGHLFDRGRLLGEARILDESAGGFRIAPGRRSERLPPVFTLLEVEVALAHEVEVAWRSAEELGVRVLSEQRLRGYVPPQYQALKEYWERAAVLRA